MDTVITLYNLSHMFFAVGAYGEKVVVRRIQSSAL